MIIVGIDPGLRGGAACIEATRGGRPILLDAIDLPVSGEGAKKRIDVLALTQWLLTHMPDYAYIERAQAMPDQGASSGFIYGRAVGACEATLQHVGASLCIIEASAWKKTLGLKGGDKEGSRQWVIHRFPSKASLFARKLDHNRSEAVCIAWCGMQIALTEAGANASMPVSGGSVSPV